MNTNNYPWVQQQIMMNARSQILCVVVIVAIVFSIIVHISVNCYASLYFALQREQQLHCHVQICGCGNSGALDILIMTNCFFKGTSHTVLSVDSLESL